MFYCGIYECVAFVCFLGTARTAGPGGRGRRAGIGIGAVIGNGIVTGTVIGIIRRVVIVGKEGSDLAAEAIEKEIIGIEVERRGKLGSACK